MHPPFVSHFPASQGSIWQPGKTCWHRDGPQGRRSWGRGLQESVRPSEPQKAVRTPRLRGMNQSRGPGLILIRPDLQSQGRDKGQWSIHKWPYLSWK